MSESYIDLVVIGEGEETCIELSKVLEKKKDLKSVLGIGFKDENNRITVNARRPFIKNLDEFSMDWSLVNIGKYIYPYEGMKRVLDFVTSRGCPHQCGFCYNSVFNERRWRAHSVDKMISEVNMLKREHNLDGIIFQDDNFFANEKRAFTILRTIGLKYHAESPASYVTPEFASQLAQTGCHILFIGTESGSNRILKLVKKGCDIDRINSAIDTLAHYPKMRVACSAIFAYPTETRFEYRKTLMMILNHMKKHPFITYTIGFYLPYPGTDLYDLTKGEGFVPPDRTEDWEDLDRWGGHSFNINWVNWVTAEEVKRIRSLIHILARLSRRKRFSLWRKLIEVRIYLSSCALHRLIFSIESIIIEYRRYLKSLLNLLRDFKGSKNEQTANSRTGI